VLAELAKGKMRGKIPQLREALEGHFTDAHARLVAQMLQRLDRVEQALAELDQVIAEACRPWAHQLDLLQTIPGVGPKVAQVILAETGGDMSRFPSAAHLAAWAGLAPGVHESAGRRTTVGVRHGNKWLTSMLVEAAGSVGRSRDNYLSAQHARRGPAAAAPAPRWRSPTPSWSRRTSCSAGTSPTAIWDRTGSATVTTRRTPDDSSPSSNGSATPSSSIRRPDRWGDVGVTSPGLTPGALTRACNSPVHGSV
jgi:transposase